jgi:hypothetical protein
MKYPNLQKTSAPTDGVNEVQRLTGGGTISGGTFDLTLDGPAALTLIPWNVTAAQLQALVDSTPVPNIVVTGGPIATTPFTFTFQAEYGGLNRTQLTASATNLTGAGHALTPSTVTGGVKGSYRGAPKGTPLTDTTNGDIYVNSGSSQTPAWTAAPTATSWTLVDCYGTTVIESI